MFLSHSVIKTATVLTFLLGSLTVFPQLAFAQCQTYFHPGYRAIAKVPFQHNSYFRLDDWTGDGRSDYWNFQAAPGGTHNILIYPSKPTGYWDWDNPITYATTIPSSASLYRTFPEVRDFDGDGRKDLLYSARIQRNTGSGSLDALAPIITSDASTMTGLTTLGYVDVTGDNRLDWVYIYSKNDLTRDVRYQPGLVDGSFANRIIVIPHEPSADFSILSVRLGDFNGDGAVDLIRGKYVGPGALYTLHKNLGNGTFQAGAPMQFEGTDSSQVADMNGDGRTDVLTTTGGTLIINYGQANGTFSATQFPGVDFPNAIADLNGDNRLDMLTLGGFVSVGWTRYGTMINDGNGGFVQTQYLRSPLRVRGPDNGIRVEDVTGDGKADILEDYARFYDASFGSPGSSPIRNLFGQDVYVVWENRCQPSPFKVRTLNNDLHEDGTMWNPSNGQWLYKNSGLGSLYNVFNWGTQGDVPAAADFDGDGVFDLTVYRNSTGHWYILNSSDGSWSVIPFGLPGDKPVPSDYDGDSKADLAVFRPADGNWHFLLSATGAHGVVHFGSNGDKPVPADYDGDFKTDIAVYRPTGGVWYFVRSSDSSVGIMQYGIDSDIPLPADYDGDGKADLSVFRSGVWYILRSMDSTSNVHWWGIAEDIPVPFYRDGFTSQLLVYRPSNRRWYGAGFDFTGGAGQTPVRFGLPNN